ncbi:MAG: DUF448 domain-containing protein [Minicystis sp.]
MSEAVVHVESGAEREAEKAPRGRTRTCVGCAAHVELHEAGDLIRLVLGPEGEIAVDAHGGAFGRGAHVHARPACLDRAVKGGLARSTKGRALSVLGADGERHPLNAASLARAIQEAMSRRIEGLFAAAVRSRQLARGADAVTSACQRGEAELVVVACDAAAAADLTEVRRAVSEGRAVAWADKQRLGRMVVLGKSRAEDQDVSGVAVVALLSRPMAEGLRQAVRIADTCAGKATEVAPTRPKQGSSRPRKEPRGARMEARDRDRSGRDGRVSKGLGNDGAATGLRGPRREPLTRG